MTRQLYNVLAIALMAYFFLYGAIFNGIMNSQVQAITLFLLVALVAGWIVTRTRGGWTWHSTPLDVALPFWLIAFAVSLVANSDNWRQIITGLWYSGLYVALWYMLSDAVANKKIARSALVDGVLVSGVVLVVTTFVDLANAGTSNDGFLGLPRPAGLFSNTNSLATYMVVLALFALARLIDVKNLILRLGLAVLALASLFILFLTFSRGAWIGAAVGLLIGGLLLLAHYDLLSSTALRGWFSRQSRSTQTLIGGGIVLALLVGVIGTVVLINSLSKGGRGVDNRTYLYAIGIDNFLEKPLTGSGLFTFSRMVERAQATDPEIPRQLHNHAHNIFIHVAAELGIFGLAALLVTLWTSIRAFRLNWRTCQDRLLLIAGAAGAAGFAVHHLFDVTAMLPAIAILAVVTLATMSAPVEPVASPARRFVYAGVVGLWVVVLAAGLWTMNLYGQFMAVNYGGGDYAAKAAALQPIVDSDPRLPNYRIQQANFYALAAHEGDTNALNASIDDYRELTRQMPGAPMVWANLAALLWQSGDQDAALEAIQRASDLDQASWQFALIWARYAEATGKPDLARVAYLRAGEEALLHPALNDSPIVQEMIENVSGLPQIVLLYEQGEYEEAARLWDASPEETASGYVVRALIALAQNDRDSAWLDKAKTVADLDNPWIVFGQSRLDGQSDDAVIEKLTPPLFGADYGRGAFMMRATYMLDMLAMAYVPQLGYSDIDPMLQRLLAK